MFLSLKKLENGIDGTHFIRTVEQLLIQVEPSAGEKLSNLKDSPPNWVLDEEYFRAWNETPSSDNSPWLWILGESDASKVLTVVVILVDGLDELPEMIYHDIIPKLRKLNSPEAQVILTSREGLFMGSSVLSERPYTEEKLGKLGDRIIEIANRNFLCADLLVKQFYTLDPEDVDHALDNLTNGLDELIRRLMERIGENRTGRETLLWIIHTVRPGLQLAQLQHALAFSRYSKNNNLVNFRKDALIKSTPYFLSIGSNSDFVSIHKAFKDYRTSPRNTRTHFEDPHGLIAKACLGCIERRRNAVEGFEEPTWDQAEYTPLYMASRLGNNEIVEVLIAQGADPNKQNGPEGVSAFQAAIAAGHEKVVDIILETASARKKQDMVSRRDSLGRLPLMDACGNINHEGNPKIVRRILKAMKSMPNSHELLLNRTGPSSKRTPPGDRGQ
ncbi:hypothetical protein QQX98_000506 [Neonectria punicea]|uniref:Uncharacterized protein n=1 Tax=Neonectria punicea TaxID=979145 RepID=A0ABR1HU57_9HYPO